MQKVQILHGPNNLNLLNKLILYFSAFLVRLYKLYIVSITQIKNTECMENEKNKSKNAYRLNLK